ncbi:copper amine oxidase [Methylotetracoccus oryzae]|uniref:copper amine oxidase n=1 Tax=Methylotetracoccus oryzae TaxID=1919059 RepID=UPI00111A5154|nr:tyramine oxidase [Methylotetracoccus oryzae]
MRHLLPIAALSLLASNVQAAAAPGKHFSPRLAARELWGADDMASRTSSAARTCVNPLTPLTKGEIERAVQIVKGDPRTFSGAFFPTVVLKEPPKGEVLAFRPGETGYRREAFVEMYDRKQNRLQDAVVDLKSGQIVSFRTYAIGVQPATYGSEYGDVGPLVTADAEWQAAIRKRGIDPDDVYLDIWAGGDIPIATDREGKPLPPGTRMMRVLSFYRGTKPNPYDRPIEGVVVAVDMNRLKILQVTDTVVAPVSVYNGNASSAEREPLKALKVEQPEGPGYQVCGNEVTWQGWHFRFAMLPREGLVLYTIGQEEEGAVRSVAYRISMTEIFVPYGLPDTNWVWRTAFDIGEYGMGRYANPLSDKGDVPSNAEFFHARIADDVGGSYVIPNSIALYERDGGMLWKRVDPTSVVQDSRKARELVLTSSAWIGNYIYGVEYIFRLDGSLEARVNATGTTLNQGVNSFEEGEAYGRTMDRNKSTDAGKALVAAPNHQHFFNFRIDMDIDGPTNRALESNVKSAPTDLDNAFVSEERVLGNEDAAKRDINIDRTRTWKVVSSTAKNGLGSPTGYTLYAGDVAVPYASPNFAARQRAAFVDYPLWITQYKEDEMFATGDHPNQGQAGEGLPQYSNGEALADTDVVLWISSGLTHIPDIEQHPVMNNESVQAFRLTPYGFFRRNPALNLPK